MDEFLNENGWEYYVNDNEAYITDAPLAEDESNFLRNDTYFIPEEIGGYPVVMHHTSLTDVMRVRTVHLSKNTRYYEIPIITIDLEAITVDEENPYFASKNGILYSKDFKTLVSFPAAKKYFHPSFLEGVEVIAESAFSFADYISSIVIPDTVKEIGDYAFSHCKDLEAVELPDSIEALGSNVFYDSPVKAFRFPENKKHIEPYSLIDGEKEDPADDTDTCP